MIGNEWDTDEQEQEELFDEHHKTILRLICKSLWHTSAWGPNQNLCNQARRKWPMHMHRMKRLLSFREGNGGSDSGRRWLQTGRKIPDLRDPLDEFRRFRLLRSSNLSPLRSSFSVASVNWFSYWDITFSLMVARKFHRRFCKEWR